MQRADMRQEHKGLKEVGGSIQELLQQISQRVQVLDLLVHMLESAPLGSTYQYYHLKGGILLRAHDPM
jgi:hypothetical protein